MPLVRIDLHAGKPEEYLRAISDAVHHAMIECFAIPERDQFQVISEHTPARLIANKRYFDIERSDNTVFVQVFFSAGRTVEQKQAFYARLTTLLHENPGIRPQDVLIVLTENHREDWSFGNGEAQYVTKPPDQWK